MIDPDRSYERPAREFTRQEAIDEAVRRVLAMGWFAGTSIDNLAASVAPLVRVEFRNIIRT